MPSNSNTMNLPIEKRGFLTLVLAALAIFAPFATDMYLSGFTSIAADLNTDISNVQFSLSTFFIGMALGQLLYGPLADKYGRRIPLVIGIVIFIVSSLAIALAPNIQMFNGFRFIQAIGGCSGMVISRAIIQDVYDQKESAQALSLIMVIQGVGPIVAPILGAYILVSSSWNVIFYFLTVFGLLCLALTYKYVPESLPKEQRQSQNMASIYRGFKALLSDKSFLLPSLSGGLAVSVMFCFITGSPNILMNIYGLSQQHYSWAFSGTALLMVVMSQLNRMLLARFSPQVIFNISVFISLLAAVMLFFLRDTANIFVFMAPLALCIGLVPVVSANAMALAMSSRTKDAGSASSLIGVLQFGFAGGISALVSTMDNGTSLPMTGMILMCSACAFVLNRLR
ncbi:multidrug effflux MFS transporter [Vibrio sp. CDRSL-10 TSBA]